MTWRASKSIITAAGGEIGPHPDWTRLRLEKLNDLFHVDGRLNRKKVVPESFSAYKDTAGQDADQVKVIVRVFFKPKPESIFAATLDQIFLQVQSPIVTRVLHLLYVSSLEKEEADENEDE